jgi:RHS repeat-associated protein
MFTGQYLDSESGLYQNRARYYDPVTATWITVDPRVSSTMQPYVYVAGDPLNITDMTGLSPNSDTGGAGAFGYDPRTECTLNLDSAGEDCPDGQGGTYPLGATPPGGPQFSWGDVAANVGTNAAMVILPGGPEAKLIKNAESGLSLILLQSSCWVRRHGELAVNGRTRRSTMRCHPGTRLFTNISTIMSIANHRFGVSSFEC